MAGRRIQPNQLSAELKRVGSLATEKEVETILKKVTLGAFRDLVMFSAVDTGFLRSNWSVTTTSAGDRPLRNSGGSFSSASYSNVNIKVGAVITLYNNTEYARMLEYGSSGRRAQPMVQPTYYRTLNELKSLADNLSRKKVA